MRIRPEGYMRNLELVKEVLNLFTYDKYRIFNSS
jgi:hypothetical protein